MSKAPVKFFRNPEDAHNALKELKAQGYKPEEVGLLARERKEAEAFLAEMAGPVVRGAMLTNIGPVLAAGPVARALESAKDGDAAELLAQVIELPEGRIGFYQFGLAMGGVLLSIHVEGERAQQAKQILRKLETASIGPTGPTGANSPGFLTGSRMAETNPRDAEMTGDFRRY